MPPKNSHLNIALLQTGSNTSESDDLELGLNAPPKSKRNFKRCLIVTAILSLLMVGGAAGYHYLHKSDSNNDDTNKLPQPFSPDCFGNPFGNATCPAMPITGPMEIIQKGIAVNTEITLQASCCPDTNMTENICCPPSQYSNWTYWFFVDSHVEKAPPYTGYAVGGILADTVGTAIKRGLSFFSSRAFSGKGVACEVVNHPDEQWCSFSNLTDSAFLADNPDFITSREKVLVTGSVPSKTNTSELTMQPEAIPHPALSRTGGP